MAYQRTLSVQHVGTGAMAATVLSAAATVREFEATARSVLGLDERARIRLSVGAPGDGARFLQNGDARMVDVIDGATRVVHVLEASEASEASDGDESAFTEVGAATADDPLLRKVAARVEERALALARGIAARDQKLRLQRGAPISLASA